METFALALYGREPLDLLCQLVTHLNPVTASMKTGRTIQCSDTSHTAQQCKYITWITIGTAKHLTAKLSIDSLCTNHIVLLDIIYTSQNRNPNRE